MRLPRALWAFLLASLCLTAACLGTTAVYRYLLHLGPPFNYPSLQNSVRFPDFHYFISKFAFFHSPAFYHVSFVLPYPAPMLVAMKLFMLPQPGPAAERAAIFRYECAILLAAAVMLFLLVRGLLRQGLGRPAALAVAVGLPACGFAFWFEFSQGNIEWVVWTVMMTGIWAFCTGRERLAAICFGIGGSMKIFPIIFIGLFIAARRYVLILWSFAAAIVSTVVCLWLVCPSVGLSARETASALGVFTHEHMAQIRPFEGGFDHSLFGVVKLILNATDHTHHHEVGLGVYLLLAATVGCILFFWRIQRLPLTNQVLCLTVAAVLLPPVSYDYTLIHLYAPLALLAFLALAAERRGVPVPPGTYAVLLLLAFILSPEQEFFFHARRFSGQLKCLALLLLGYAALRYPLPLPQGALGAASLTDAQTTAAYSLGQAV